MSMETSSRLRLSFHHPDKSTTLLPTSPNNWSTSCNISDTWSPTTFAPTVDMAHQRHLLCPHMGTTVTSSHHPCQRHTFYPNVEGRCTRVFSPTTTNYLSDCEFRTCTCHARGIHYRFCRRARLTGNVMVNGGFARLPTSPHGAVSKCRRRLQRRKHEK